MHELSLCRSIHAVADRSREGREVEVIHLRLGQLRQVVPETLVYCWDLVVDGTELTGSRLNIDHVPITLRCNACGVTTTVKHQLVLTCGDCGSGDVTMLTGEEFMITSMDLRKEHTHG